MPYVLKCHTENKPILKIENNAKESDSDGTEIAMIVVKGLMGATMFIFFAVIAYKMKKRPTSTSL